MRRLAQTGADVNDCSSSRTGCTPLLHPIGLAVRHPTPRRRSNYLPISPTPPRPDNGRLQRSWVNISTRHTVPFAVLRPFRYRHDDGRDGVGRAIPRRGQPHAAMGEQ
jgi:hypothetical protein